MDSQKDLRSRINSVASTRKTTSAMQMVSSSKLRKAQTAIERLRPYQNKLSEILANYLAAADNEISHPLAEKREVQHVAIVAIASNSSLCGAFNSNVIKETIKVLDEYNSLSRENITLITAGKKVSDALKNKGIKIDENLPDVVDKPTYEKSISLINELVELFLSKKVDKVELIYNHFKSSAVQEIVREELLPLKPSPIENGEGAEHHLTDYIIEPDGETLLKEIVPKVVRLQFHAAVLDSSASEFSARTVAMEIATENANEMLEDLRMQYNKARQEAITNEILDIVTGAEAQSKS